MQSSFRNFRYSFWHFSSSVLFLFLFCFTQFLKKVCVTSVRVWNRCVCVWTGKQQLLKVYSNKGLRLGSDNKGGVKKKRNLKAHKAHKYGSNKSDQTTKRNRKSKKHRATADYHQTLMTFTNQCAFTHTKKSCLLVQEFGHHPSIPNRCCTFLKYPENTLSL